MNKQVAPLPIKKILEDKELKVRSIDEEHVLNLKNVLKKGGKLPPIHVFRISDRPWDGYVLVDGWHRLTARAKIGQDTIYVIIHEGSFLDALDYAVEANTQHALPLKRADRKMAARKLLVAAPERANRWIADLAGIDDHTVKDIRVELEAKGEIPIIERYIRRDGRETDKTVSRESGRGLQLKVNFASQSQLDLVLRAIDHVGKTTGSDKINYCLECISADYLSGVGEPINKRVIKRIEDFF